MKCYLKKTHFIVKCSLLFQYIILHSTYSKKYYEKILLFVTSLNNIKKIWKFLFQNKKVYLCCWMCLNLVSKQTNKIRKPYRLLKRYQYNNIITNGVKNIRFFEIKLNLWLILFSYKVFINYFYLFKNVWAHHVQTTIRTHKFKKSPWFQVICYLIYYEWTSK